jgi:hypothetical protein
VNSKYNITKADGKLNVIPLFLVTIKLRGNLSRKPALEIDMCILKDVEVWYVSQLEIVWTPSVRLIWLAWH